MKLRIFVKLCILLLLAALSVSTYMFIISTYTDIYSPPSSPSQPRHFPPKTLEDAQALLHEITRKSQQSFWKVLILYSAGYLIKQAFAIPGSGVLNLLAGGMYGQLQAALLVSILASFGSLLCYLISYWLLDERIMKYLFKERLQSLKRRLPTAPRELWSFMLGVRMFPLIPQWFVNIASPHLDVPVWIFFTATLIGLVPYNFITCGAGTILNEISGWHDVMQASVLVKLFALASVIIALSYFSHRKTAAKSTKSNAD